MPGGRVGAGEFGHVGRGIVGALLFLSPFLRGEAKKHQNIRLSFTSTQRPPLTCCTWVMVLARWSVLENFVGGELKMSRNFSPDSSESSIFCPVRSLPALSA